MDFKVSLCLSRPCPKSRKAAVFREKAGFLNNEIEKYDVFLKTPAVSFGAGAVKSAVGASAVAVTQIHPLVTIEDLAFLVGKKGAGALARALGAEEKRIWKILNRKETLTPQDIIVLLGQYGHVDGWRINGPMETSLEQAGDIISAQKFISGIQEAGLELNHPYSIAGTNFLAEKAAANIVIGQRLIEQRMSRAQSRQTVADILGLNPKSYANIETGRVAAKAHILYKLSLLYGETFSSLTGLSEKNAGKSILNIQHLPSDGYIKKCMGLNLKTAREEAGFSIQYAVSNFFGKNYKYLHNLENGNQDITVKDLLILLDNYGITNPDIIFLNPKEFNKIIAKSGV